MIDLGLMHKRLADARHFGCDTTFFGDSITDLATYALTLRRKIAAFAHYARARGKNDLADVIEKLAQEAAEAAGVVHVPLTTISAAGAPSRSHGEASAVVGVNVGPRG